MTFITKEIKRIKKEREHFIFLFEKEKEKEKSLKRKINGKEWGSERGETKKSKK